MLTIKTESIHGIFCIAQNMSIGCITVFLMLPELVKLGAGLFSATASRVAVLVTRSQTWFIVQRKEIDAF